MKEELAERLRLTWDSVTSIESSRFESIMSWVASRKDYDIGASFGDVNNPQDPQWDLYFAELEADHICTTVMRYAQDANRIYSVLDEAIPAECTDQKSLDFWCDIAKVPPMLRN